MSSEYDPIPARAPLSTEPTDLERAQSLFRRAAAGYLRSPWSWWSWSLLLPTAALITRRVAPLAGWQGTLLLWSVFILIGGVVEGALIVVGSSLAERTPLAGWVMRTQGNLSLVAVALSALLLWQGLSEFLPALWLLLVGHSFYVIGKISFLPLRTAGVLFQAGGIAALMPTVDGLLVFAGCAFAGCLWVGVGVRRQRAGERASDSGGPPGDPAVADAIGQRAAGEGE